MAKGAGAESGKKDTVCSALFEYNIYTILTSVVVKAKHPGNGAGS